MERNILSMLWLLATLVSGFNSYLAESKDYTYAWGIWALMCLVFSICYSKQSDDKGVKEK